MIVIFDTNIFVSALVCPGGQAERALLRILSGADSLIISKDLLDELLTVLARKFRRDREELSRVALWLAEVAQIITTRRTLKVLADEPDNRVLEYAVAGSAEAIVSGDKALLALKSFQGSNYFLAGVLVNCLRLPTSLNSRSVISSALLRDPV